MPDTYDYIVVGAGSAGCVVAARLAEDPHVRVLLIEAGGDGLRDLVRAPALYPLLYRSERDYAFATEPQRGLLGRRVFVPRGRGLGGSSAINASIWHRGHASDYDAWAALGAEGWDAASLAPSFERVRVHTETTHQSTPLDQAFIEAVARVTGVPVHDAQQGTEGGFVGRLELSTKRGARSTVADAYMPEPRANLSVLLAATVNRIVFEGLHAREVELVSGGAPLRMRASREIILCAGAIASPAILMRSGIGDPDALARLDIDVVHALPGVGCNLHDHLYAYLTHRSRDERSRFSLADAARDVPASLERTPYAGNHVEVGAFVPFASGTPDVQLYFTTWPAPEPSLDGPKVRYDRGPCFTIMPCPLQPKSRGRVTLASASPFDAPRIDPAYLEQEDDIATFVRAFEMARAVIADRAFDAFRGEALVPAVGLTGAALEHEIRGRAGTVHHPVGTCRMGGDALSVVSPELFVHGVTGLRVADASVMPRIPSCNTNAPVVAVAERAAELIGRS